MGKRPTIRLLAFLAGISTWLGCATPLRCPDGASAVWRTERAHPELPETEILACERADGTRHGPFVSWADERMLGAGHFVEGQLEGSAVLWHANRRLWMTSDWHEGTMRDYSAWSEEGVKTNEEVWDRTGERSTTSFWYESGARKWTARLHHETFDGPYESWYESGRRKARGQYRDGLRHGSWTCWADADRDSVEATYEAGKVVLLEGDADSAAARVCRNVQGCGRQHAKGRGC